MPPRNNSVLARLAVVAALGLVGLWAVRRLDDGRSRRRGDSTATGPALGPAAAEDARAVFDHGTSAVVGSTSTTATLPPVGAPDAGHERSEHGRRAASDAARGARHRAYDEHASSALDEPPQANAPQRLRQVMMDVVPEILGCHEEWQRFDGARLGTLVLRVTVSSAAGIPCEAGGRSGVHPRAELITSELGHVFLEECVRQAVAELCVTAEDVEVTFPLRFADVRDEEMED